jgi:hypothetical protein
MRTTIRNRKHSGTYPEPIGPDTGDEWPVCSKCGTHADDVNWIDHPDGSLVQLCADCDHEADYPGLIIDDPEHRTQATCWPVNEDGQPEYCGCNRHDCENPEPGTRHLNTRPDYEHPHPEHVAALREIQAEIHSAEAKLTELKAERLARINAALADGMQKVRMCAPLGVSKQQVNRWTTEAKEARRIAGERELF